MNSTLPPLNLSLFALQILHAAVIYASIHSYTGSSQSRIKSLSVSLAVATLYFLACRWMNLVHDYSPEPYLDEVFHVPQAQVYCEGRYGDWDDKITTPPGLYVLTLLFSQIARSACTAYDLRFFNVVTVSYLALVAMVCRARYEQSKLPARIPRRYSSYAIGTGVNVALFPVLFFFSGLYYTDAISTFVVLLAYMNHLSRVSGERISIFSDIYTVFVGILALCMRQTNIFWVVIYMGGLEAVRAIKTLKPKSAETPEFTTLAEQIQFYVWRYSLGDIHDPPLNLASPIDFLLCIVSVGIAVLSNLWMIVNRHIWPHLIVLVAFVAFVAWNGGVVLGDKSNHVATLHLTQMLYIWPLFAFFSAPLFIPKLLGMVGMVYRVLTSSNTSNAQSKHQAKPATNQSPALQTFNALGSSHRIHSVLVLVGALILATLIVRFNTIIHPFTLADNRHYMFYIFRYSILKVWWIRYALVPIYVGCGWLCWTALQGSSLSDSTQGVQWIRTPFAEASREDATAPNAKLSTKDAKQPYTSAASTTAAPPSTSTVLILFLATTLSLMTAPLVEPRYFILPWVFWRLLMPAWPAHTNPATGGSQPISRLGSSFDLRLLLETAWFLLVNVGTMYIFLTRPFYWKAPNGTLLDDGRVQRFMW